MEYSNLLSSPRTPIKTTKTPSRPPALEPRPVSRKRTSTDDINPNLVPKTRRVLNPTEHVRNMRRLQDRAVAYFSSCCDLCVRKHFVDFPLALLSSDKQPMTTFTCNCCYKIVLPRPTVEMSLFNLGPGDFKLHGADVEDSDSDVDDVYACDYIQY